jgi:hypothetical protein
VENVALIKQIFYTYVFDHYKQDKINISSYALRRSIYFSWKQGCPCPMDILPFLAHLLSSKLFLKNLLQISAHLVENVALIKQLVYFTPYYLIIVTTHMFG